MAKFEVFDDNDDFLPNSITTDCPICGKEIEISLELKENYVICPHCNAKIEIEST